MKHLSTGSEDVPLKENSIRLYSMRFCPYAHRVHLVLLAKKIPFDVVFINLKQKPEWYLERVATGKVPAMLIDGKNIYESLIIADYLDDKYPEPPLHPKNPLQKALDRILVDRFSKVTSALYKLYTAPTKEISVLETAFDELDHFEKELVSRGTPFYSGTNPGMADYMIWPWLERIQMLKVIAGDQFQIPENRFPKLLGWMKKMLEDPAVKEFYCTPEEHAKFLQSHLSGSPDYDNIISRL